MPRSRATEMPQGPSPRAQTIRRTDSDPTHRRSRTDKTPRLTGGQSPRGSQSDPVGQKKLGTRIANLESQLGQAQEELKCLKDQLSSAEAAKKAAQEQLEKKSRKVGKVPGHVEIQGKQSLLVEDKKESSDKFETSDDVLKETEVFEVPVESSTDKNEHESALKKDEINSLKIELDEKGKEVKFLREENEKIKKQLHEKSIKFSSAESKIEGLTLELDKANQELEKRRTSEAWMMEKLEAAERAKEELECEMKRLRVQTEQWRKAADAAASVLAEEVETNGRRISERCGSMEKHYGNAYESGRAGYVGSPGGGDDVFGVGKRKGSGIRMFGDLWRKKGSN